MSDRFPTADDDDLARVFPGRQLTHVIRVASADQLAVALAALAAVRDGGGELHALSLQRCGDGFEHRLSLTGLKPSEARRLTASIGALPGVADARIEHQILCDESAP